jgi:hypothetical protein
MRNPVLWNVCAVLSLAALPASPAVHVWEKQEITLTAQEKFDNAYRDVDVWVDLNGPGFARRVYGFWDGGSTFRVRVLATAPGEWTWVSGSNTYISSGNNGNYGSGPGSTGPGIVPGARFRSISWIDSAGNLWLFGGSPGEGLANNGVSGTLDNYNDTWMFNPSTNYWTYVSGPTSMNVGGSCNGVGQTGLPGARDQAGFGVDLSGHLWMFGGDGKDCGGNQNNLGDLWKY